LKIAMETAFGEHSNGKHHIKNASQEMHHLAYQITKSRSITKHSHGHSSLFQSKDILQHGYEILESDVKRFNHLIVEQKWKKKEDLENATTTSITVLNDIVAIDNDVDD